MKNNNSISKQNYNKQVALTKYVRNIKYKQNSIEIKLLQRKRKINNEQNKVTSSINNMNNVNNKTNIHYNEEKFILKGEEFNHDKLNYFLNKRINTKIDTARSQTKNIINNVLPIFHYKDTILQKLSENRIIIICGNTGCGKSTQIFNFFLFSKP